MDSAEELRKAIDRTKLVQVKVTVNGKNGTFTRMQWKKPSDVKSTDVVVNQQDSTDKTNKQDDSKQQKSSFNQSEFDKLKNSDRNKALEYAKKNGITWKENGHDGINWMRCMQAIKKQASQPANNKPVQKQSDTQQSGIPSDWDSRDKKRKIASLLKDHNRNELMEAAKKNGVTWKENKDSEGINWMRASMAIQKFLDTKSAADMEKLQGFKFSKPEETMSKDDIKQEIKNEVKKQVSKEVKKQSDETKNKEPKTEKKESNKEPVDSYTKLEDFVGDMTGKAVDSKKIGVRRTAKSDREKDKFGDIIKNSSEESLENYRTLGMCAGDKKADEYLARLYKGYSKSAASDLSGKNSPFYGVIQQNIIKNIQKLTDGKLDTGIQHKDIESIIKPWTNPNWWDDESKADLSKKRDGKLENLNKKEFATETSGDNAILLSHLSELEKNPDYSTEVKEYRKLIEEYNKLTANNKEFQELCVTSVLNTRNKNLLLGGLKYKTDDRSYATQTLNKLRKIMKENKLPKYREEHYKNVIESLESFKKEASKMSAELESGDDSRFKRIAEIHKELIDPKFNELNVNLLLRKKMSDEISGSYFTTRNFIKEFPVLSKDNIHKLNEGDSRTLTNLAIHIGSFKPSLGKNGKNPFDELKSKMQERADLLDAYMDGSLNIVTSSKNRYLEDNEIKCKVSSVDSATHKKIADKIQKDWDMVNHGSMKYKIKGIYQVSDLPVEEEYDKIKSRHSVYNKDTCLGKSCDSDLFYHGTGSMATSLILGHSGGFKIAKAKVGRMMGDGIYLADKSSKSAQYIGDDGFGRRKMEGSLMLVEASLGQTAPMGAMYSMKGMQADSIYAGASQGVLNSEWCVKDPNAVLPKYLVEMEVE